MHQPEIERQRPGRDDGLRHRVHQQRLLRCFLIGCNVGLVLFYLYGVYSNANNALERTVPRREPGLDNNGALPDLAKTPLHANVTPDMFCAATQYPFCPAEPSVPHETVADSAWIKGDDADAFDAKRDVGSEDAPTEPRRPDFQNGYLWTYRNAYADTPPAAGRQSAGFPDGLIMVSRNWFGSFADAVRRLYDVLRYALGFETFRPQFSSLADMPSSLLLSLSLFAPPIFDWFGDFEGCLRYLDASPQADKLLRCFFKTGDIDSVCSFLDHSAGPCARIWQLHRERIALYKQLPGFG